MDKLEKLKSLVKLLQNDTITPSKLTQIVGVLVGVVKKSQEKNEKLSKEITKALKDTMSYIENQNEKLFNETEKKLSKTQTDAQKALSEAQKALSEILKIEVRDGVDGVDGEKGEKGDKGDDGSPDTGEQIVEKINSLNEKAPKIDASHIKNLPQSVTQIFEQGGHGFVETPIKAGANVSVTKDTSGAYVISSASGSSSPLTTKGDLYTYSTTDARLPVGTDGYVLKADSSEATGLKWAVSTSTDEKVSVDSAATAGYIGAAGNDGVLRVDSSLGYADGGDFVTLSLDSTLKGNYDAAFTHVSSDGSDHTFIDQDVTSGSSPTFDGANFTGVDAANVDIADAGGIITATDVEGALQENRTAIDAIEADYLTSTDIGSTVQAYDAQLASLAGLTPGVEGNIIESDGLGGFAMITPANFITNNNILDTGDIGSSVQAYDADLTTLAGLSSADGNFIVGSATGWVVESGATARASLGVDPAGTDNSTDVTLNALVTDVLSLSTQEISAVDNGSDAIVGWDDDPGKLTYLSAGDVRTIINVADGADVTGSNPPQAHAASHAVGGADTVFPADPGADRYLMWDDSESTLVWSEVSAGGGDVSKVGTPADNQVGVWTGDGTIEGTANLTYDGSNLQLTGDIGSTGTRINKGWFTDLEVTNAIAGSVTGNAGTVTNATLTTPLTVNTGTVTLTGNVANNSVLTIGAGAVSVSGSNTGDQTSIVGISGTTAEFNTALSDANFYTTGGSDVSLADGGTGASLTDPNADRIMFWDDSASAVTWLTPSTGLTISGTSMTVRASSSTQTGIVELATNAETVTGTDTARAVTPAGVTAKMAAPGAIGGTTPSTATFTTLTTTGNIELGNASDTTLSRVSAGVLAIEGSNILTASTGLALAGGTMTGDIQLGETDIKLDAVLSGDEKWSGIVIPVTLGSTVAQGEVCFLASDGKWDKVDGILDGTDTGFSKQLGICLVAGNDTDSSEMLVYGKVRSAGFPAFTVGSPVYLSDTAGDLTVTQPSTANFAIRIVGYAITAEDLLFNPSNDYIVHT